MAQINAEMVVRAISMKLVKDAEGNQVRVAVVQLITADLAAASELAWHMGQEVCIDIEPIQPRLPTTVAGQHAMETPLEQATNGTGLTREQVLADLDARNKALDEVGR